MTNASFEPQEMAELLELMAHLRGPGGCPWDREQTHQSLRRYLLEEAYETLEAIDHGHPDRLRDELGDLLLQVVFHAQMAREAGHFDFGDIVRHLSAKLKRRHPHIFGEMEAESAGEVRGLWEEIKRAERRERGREGLLESVPTVLPAAHRAQRLQEKAATVGFDWPTAKGALEKLEEELAEVEAELDGEPDREALGEELGDVLFSAVNVVRKLGFVAEELLRHTNHKFEERFGHMERRAAGQGRALEEMSLDEQEALWVEAKQT